MTPDLLGQIREGGILYVLLLIAITMHEYGHAFFADKLGDPLPRLQGRVSINPAAHMDALGTVVLPIITIALSIGSGFPLVFGWGKPVQVALDNPKTRKKIDILSTAGGVSANLFVALVSAVLVAAFFIAGLKDFQEVAVQSVYILKYAVNMSESTYYTLSRYGILILLLVVNIPITASIFRAVVVFLATVFLYAASLLVSIFQ